MTEEKLINAWEYVEDVAEKYGYSCWSHNDVSLGAGATIYKDDDIFTPIICLHIWWDEGISIHVKDRNGNSILDGPTCAIHILDDCEDFEEKLKKMCTYVFEKYSKYARTNRLDFRFNNLEEERVEWHV